MATIDRAKSIASMVDQGRLVDLACDLIRIPSPTEAEAEVASYLEKVFQDEGFETIIQFVEPNRPQVIGVLRGKGEGRSLMLNGHIDNDSIISRWNELGRKPYEPSVEDNRLWGAGIHNMKSGIAAMIEAARVINESDIVLNGDLVVACVVGELQGGKGTIHLLESGVVKADMAIVPEPYSIDRIITKCVGVQKCQIVVHGQSVHTSQQHKGVNSHHLMRSLVEPAIESLKFSSNDPDFPDPPVLVSSGMWGRGPNYDLAGPSNVPDRAMIIVDIRYSSPWTSKKVDDKIEATLKQLASDNPVLRGRYEYYHPPLPEFGVGGADMPPTDVPTDTEIVQIVSELHEELFGRAIIEKGVALPYSYCGNDTAHLEKFGIPCCLYGPRGYPDDVELHVKIDEMTQCARVLAGAASIICS